MSNSDKMVEIYKAPNEMEAQVIKGLLESYDIPCFLKSSVGSSPFGVTMGNEKIMVWESMVDSARELIVGDENV